MTLPAGYHLEADPYGKGGFWITNDLVEEGIIMPGGKLLVNPSGGLVFAGHFVGGSNMMSTWSAMRELRARDFEHAIVHGTGSSLSMYGVAVVLERRA